MAIMLNSRLKVYENIFFSASQPPDSSTILQIAGIAVLTVAKHGSSRAMREEQALSRAGTRAASKLAGRDL